jgi:hypothetical protein
MTSIDSLAVHLMRCGQWSEAVRLYRDELGVSVLQAEERVARLADEYGMTHPERWVSWLAIAFGGLSLFALAGILQLILAK